MKHRKTHCLLLLTVLTASSAIAQPPTEPQTVTARTAQEHAVIEFVAAFSQHDVDAMLNFTSDNVVWLSITGETISKETSDAESLRAAMGDYFSNRPASFSRIRQIQSSGPWVMTLEHAGRMVDGVFSGQCAYAMYQFDNDLIKSVWYFSAHTCEEPP